MFTKLFRWVYPKVPPSTSRYDLGGIRFDLALGVNPLGELVTHANTASASVTADTVSTSSDADLVNLIRETIVDVLADHSWDRADTTVKSWGGFYGDEKWEGHLDFTEIATAVLSKLRSAGVIR